MQHNDRLVSLTALMPIVLLASPAISQTENTPLVVPDIAGSLLLFHLSESENGLKLWNNSKISEDELMRRADANLLLIRF